RLLFPGVVAPILAVVGLAGSRRRERWLFATLGVLGGLLTLGPYQYVGQWRIPLPYWLLYEVVPGFSGLRVPTRFVVLVLLGLAGLAGLGVDVLTRWVRSKVEGRRSKVAQHRARDAHSAPMPAPRPSTFDLRPSTATAFALAFALLVGGYGAEYRTR